MLNQESAAKLTVVSSATKKMTLGRLAQIDPEVRGFLRAIKETGLREKALELIKREITRKKDN